MGARGIGNSNAISGAPDKIGPVDRTCQGCRGCLAGGDGPEAGELEMAAWVGRTRRSAAGRGGRPQAAEGRGCTSGAGAYTSWVFCRLTRFRISLRTGSRTGALAANESGLLPVPLRHGLAPGHAEPSRAWPPPHAAGRPGTGSAAGQPAALAPSPPPAAPPSIATAGPRPRLSNPSCSTTSRRSWPGPPRPIRGVRASQAGSRRTSGPTSAAGSSPTVSPVVSSCCCKSRAAPSIQIFSVVPPPG